jgi:N-hydroxyarylamine O-acetyltransferase
MSTPLFDLDAYLNRIHYSGSLKPTIEVLASLSRSQIYTIPFENLDIILGRGINLDPNHIFSKLVVKRRGGYCFELNGLFLMALRAIGYQAEALLARVHISGTPNGRGHQISLVTIGEKQWIVDVGFGHPSLRTPIALETDKPTVHDGRTFRLTDTEFFGFMLQTRNEEQWQNLYSFDLGYVCPADIDFGNHFTSTHPRSLFTSRCIAILPDAAGVTKLINLTLTTHLEGEEISEELDAGEQYVEVLRAHFGIDLEVSDGSSFPPIPFRKAD